MKPWRLALLYALLVLLPIAQQAALVCCLSCVLHDQAGVEQSNSRDTAQDRHGEHSNSESACETCGSCGSLLAAAPPFLSVVVRCTHSATHESWSLNPHVCTPSVPFASRAPPPTVT